MAVGGYVAKENGMLDGIFGVAPAQKVICAFAFRGQFAHRPASALSPIYANQTVGLVLAGSGQQKMINPTVFAAGHAALDLELLHKGPSVHLYANNYLLEGKQRCLVVICIFVFQLFSQCTTSLVPPLNVTSTGSI